MNVQNHCSSNLQKKILLDKYFDILKEQALDAEKVLKSETPSNFPYNSS